jgi:hypothetical protein
MGCNPAEGAWKVVWRTGACTPAGGEWRVAQRKGRNPAGPVWEAGAYIPASRATEAALRRSWREADNRDAQGWKAPRLRSRQCKRCVLVCLFGGGGGPQVSCRGYAHTDRHRDRDRRVAGIRRWERGGETWRGGAGGGGGRRLQSLRPRRQWRWRRVLNARKNSCQSQTITVSVTVSGEAQATVPERHSRTKQPGDEREVEAPTCPAAPDRCK